MSRHPVVDTRERVLTLYRELGRGLYAYALALTGQPADAEDAVQESFLRLGRHLDAGGDASHLRGWLYRVCGNLARDTLRQRRRTAPEPVVAPRLVGRPLEALALRRVLDTLEPRDRELVLLRGLGLSYHELAQATGIRETSIGKLLARALERFETAYRREHGTEDGR